MVYIHADLILMKKDEHLKKGWFNTLNHFE